MANKKEIDRFNIEYIDDNLDKFHSDKEKLIFLIELSGDFEKLRIKRKRHDNELKEVIDSMEADKFREYIKIEINRLEKIIFLKNPDNEKSLLGESLSKIDSEQDSLNIEFNPKYIEPIYENIGFLFSEKDKPILKKLLNGNKIKGKITFLKSGNQLADIFKQLSHLNIIILKGDKMDLENWLLNNFRYHDMTKKGRIADFIISYLHKQISGKVDPCKKPLFKIFVDSSLCLFFEPVESEQKKSNY